MLQVELIDSLKRILGVEDVELEVPVREEHGDFSTNIAMQIFSSKDDENKILKHIQDDGDRNDYMSPKQLAEYVVGLLRDDQYLSNIIRDIQVAGQGFINFWIKDEILIGNLKEVLEKQNDYGKTDFLKGKRIMFEYGDANTHKLPHIGHLFSYIYGDSVTHILKANGAEVFRASYQGDVGLHVAKCLWAYQKEKPEVPEELADKVQLLQKMYQQGNQAFEENEQAKQDIKDINKAIYDQDAEIYDLWKQTRQWSVDYYKQFEERLGIQYDRYFYESEVYEKGKEIVESNVGKVFKKSEGALIFEGSMHGLHDRVFVTKYGTPTYEAKEMYLQELKRKEWSMDKLVITTAYEQNEYFKVVFKALETLDPGYAGVLKHIGFGMVSLTTGKMGSRHGNIVRAIELVEMVVEEIKRIIQTREDLSESEKEEIAEVVGVGSVKYYFLKNNPVQDIKYDIEQSVSIDGNSGPYLQYTYARTQSVLNKVKGKRQEVKVKQEDSHSGANEMSDTISQILSSLTLLQYDNEWKISEEESLLLRHLVHYSGAIIDAGKNYSPNVLANYLYELAQKYNSFYNKHRILETGSLEQATGNSKDKSLDTEQDEMEAEESNSGDSSTHPENQDSPAVTSTFRLALTAVTGQVLKNGLNLLGIIVPEKM